MTAPSKIMLCALFCLAAAMAVDAEVYFEENFDDGEYLMFLRAVGTFHRDRATEHRTYLPWFGSVFVPAALKLLTRYAFCTAFRTRARFYLIDVAVNRPE